jgi:hypothetical protein
MRRRLSFLLFALVAAVFLAGCGGGDDAVVQPESPTGAGASLAHGDISGSAASFEFTTEVDLDLPNPPPGPFLIRGQLVGYDADLGALVVDLTVVNASPHAYPEPVGLTFIQLLPPEVTVLNADNGEPGVGASFLFTFANDDAMWTPGEESLPRTVQFAVAPGVAIGFAARIDVGMNPLGGAIGGLVWHDVNEDGVVDPGEPGFGGVGIRIEGGDGQQWLMNTAPDGAYRVDGLPAGYYTVVRLPRPDLRATTPPQMQVLLVENDGGVSDFLTANFGCRVIPPDGAIHVGDCLHVKGEYAARPPRLVASQFCVCDQDSSGGDEDKDPDCWGRVIGPVTEVNLARHAVAIMGTWMHVADDHFDLEHVSVRDRLQASVHIVMDDGGHHLEACRLHRFNGNYDRIRGMVQEVVLGDNGQIVGVRILDTRVDLVNAAADCDD